MGLWNIGIDNMEKKYMPTLFGSRMAMTSAGLATTKKFLMVIGE